VRAEVQRYEDTTQLFVAMGGGWWKDGSAEQPSREDEQTEAEEIRGHEHARRAGEPAVGDTGPRHPT
jgi:hypothetical protein